MESIGSIFKKVRTEKDISLDKIARSTKISKQLIIALEDEDYEAFPGETYLIGFIRIYAEHLNLDSDRMVNIYKNTILQEQPIPVEQLVGKRKINFKPILIGAGGFALATVLVLIIVLFSINRKQDNLKNIEHITSSSVLQYSGGKFTKRVFKGDKVAFTINEKDYLLTISEIDDTGVLFTIGELSYSLAMGQARDIDVNDDAKIDLNIAASDFNSKNKSLLLKLNDSESIISTALIETVAIERKNIFVLDNSSVESPFRELENIDLGYVANLTNAKIELEFAALVLVEIIRENKIELSKKFTRNESHTLDLSSPVIVSVSNAGRTTIVNNDNKLRFGNKESFACYLIKADYDIEKKEYKIEGIPYY